MADIPEIQDTQAEAEEQRRTRLIQWERAMIAEGIADLERGDSYDLDTVEAWLDALDANPNATLPPPTRRS